MIVEVPFIYTAQVVPPRKRNAREVKVIDRLPLKLRVASDADFPVAFRFVAARDVPFGEKEAAKALANPQEIRWDGRGLYSAWGRGAPEPMTAADIERGLAEGRFTPFAELQHLAERNYLDGRRVPPVQRAQIEGHIRSDDRQEKIAALVERSCEVILHNGVFYDPESEPCWEVDADRHYPSVRATLGYGFELERAPHKFYRADRLAEALAAAASERADGPPVVQGRLDVLMPEALRLRLEDRHLVHVAKETVEGLKGEVWEATPEFFATYAWLRDLAKAAPEDQASEDLAEAARAMVDAMPERLPHDTGNWRRERLEQALERWRNEFLRGLDPAALDAPVQPPRLPAPGR